VGIKEGGGGKVSFLPFTTKFCALEGKREKEGKTSDPCHAIPKKSEKKKGGGGVDNQGVTRIGSSFGEKGKGGLSGNKHLLAQSVTQDQSAGEKRGGKEK